MIERCQRCIDDVGEMLGMDSTIAIAGVELVPPERCKHWAHVQLNAMTPSGWSGDPKLRVHHRCDRTIDRAERTVP